MSISQRMPAIFFGHGSPMNALENNRYTHAWEQLGQRFPSPKAILMISAHWMTHGVAVTAMAQPETIHDFGGFPQALFEMQYPAPGDPALAARIADLLAPEAVVQDQQWGLDHGTWSVLVKAYPAANIPVVQLSLNMDQPEAWHFSLGKKLAQLREEGVMVAASGNVVHNLRRLAFHAPAYDWATRFNTYIRQAMLDQQWDKVIGFAQVGSDAALSVPTTEHFLPLLYILACHTEQDQLEIVVDGIELGAISMMSVVIT